MKHIEFHTAETEKDAESLEFIGLIDFGTEEFCEHCSRQVAFTDTKFIPCGVVLDGESEFLLCIPCAEPFLNPGFI